MPISFNNISDDQRTPGAYVEIDNSRALKGLYANPHKALLIGQMLSAGTRTHEELIAITRDGLADGYFGLGSPLARMINIFKKNNPNTELWACAVSISTGAGAKASACVQFSTAVSANGGSCGGAGTVYMMINGVAMDLALTSTWSIQDINSYAVTKINALSTLPVSASNGGSAISNTMVLIAKYSGTIGNYLDVRVNYYDHQSLPAAMSGDSITITNFAGGSGEPDIDPVWSLIDDEQFHYIGMPYSEAADLSSVEDELDDRFGPMIDQQGHCFTAYKATAANLTTKGNSRNSPYVTIMGYYNAPQDTCEWAGALTAKAAHYLNQDPARPLHGIELKGILPPPISDRFTRAERNTLLYDGIATYTTNVGKVYVERCITTYQTNAAGVIDPSYLDVQTLATLSEIRYQYKTRMYNRFISPRFKLADNTFPVQPGSYVATPSLIRGEIIALFSELQSVGLIENLEDFIENLIVERNSTDRNRVDVLLAPTLIGQFRMLATKIEFLL